MEDIYLICKIIEFDSILLYNFLCINKNLYNNILKNIIILNLIKNTKIHNKELKYIPNIKILNLNKNENITNEGLILKNNGVVF